MGDQRGPVVPVTRVHLPEPDVQQERLDPEAALQLLLQLHLCASFKVTSEVLVEPTTTVFAFPLTTDMSRRLQNLELS